MKTSKFLIVLLLALILGLALGGMARAESEKDYLKRGIEAARRGQSDQAIADFNKALELNPKYAEAYNDRGNAFFLKGQWDQAIADYSKALELNPRLAGTYNNRAMSFYNKKEYGKAWEDVRKAQSSGEKINPDFLARLSRALGRENVLAQRNVAVLVSHTGQDIVGLRLAYQVKEGIRRSGGLSLAQNHESMTIHLVTMDASNKNPGAATIFGYSITYKTPGGGVIFLGPSGEKCGANRINEVSEMIVLDIEKQADILRSNLPK